MSIRIGWSRSRPKSRKRGKVAGGVWLFELLAVRDDGRGRHFVLGILSYNRQDLQRFIEKGQVLDIRVVGVLRFSSDVTPTLVTSVARRVDVIGKLIASPEVKDAITTKTRIHASSS